jgi:hypothetical protein
VTVDPEHITTDQAADIVGVSPSTFRVWAHRRGVKAVGHHRARGAGAAALWRAEDVYAATAHDDVVLLPKVAGDTPARESAHGVDNRSHGV